MKFIHQFKWLIFSFVVTVMVSCQAPPSKVVSLTVHLKGYSDTTGVYLDILRNGYVPFDTARCSQAERFDFYKDLPSADFFRLRLANGQTMPLILYPGEYSVLMVNSDDFSDSPSISGNPDTKALWDAQIIANEFGKDLAQLRRHFVDSLYPKPNVILKDSFVRYVDTLLLKRREELRLLLNQNQLRLASLPLLMQTWGNHSFFRPDSNRLVFVQTDTALTRHFGQVPGVRAFHYQLDSAIAAIDSTESVRLGEKLPDPRIPNAWGEMISLLRFHRNPLLVFIWQSGNRDSEEAVASVKSIYESYRSQGLDLYMISVDSIAAQWEKSVNHYRLPCTQVCDFKGTASPIWKRYDIQSVPSCFLLDRKGVIVLKNEWGDQLNKAVSKQFAQ